MTPLPNPHLESDALMRAAQAQRLPDRRRSPRPLSHSYANFPIFRSVRKMHGG